MDYISSSSFDFELVAATVFEHAAGVAPHQRLAHGVGKRRDLLVGRATTSAPEDQSRRVFDVEGGEQNPTDQVFQLGRVRFVARLVGGQVIN